MAHHRLGHSRPRRRGLRHHHHHHHQHQWLVVNERTWWCYDKGKEQIDKLYL